jgi:uncharacterized pyridoxamine 5'-phosphate oxidase family protein
MTEVYEFLKNCQTYYLATVEGNQPKLRPFGTAHVFENKLYIQTGKVKPVAKQILANPKIAICAMDNGKWLRIEAEAIEDSRIEAIKSMLDAYPNLRDRYKEDDGNTVVFYLKNAVATISSFTAPAKTINF